MKSIYLNHRLRIFSHILKIYPGQSKLTHLSYRFCPYNYDRRFPVITAVTKFRTANKIVRSNVLLLVFVRRRKYYLIVVATTFSLVHKLCNCGIKPEYILNFQIIISRRLRQYCKVQSFISVGFTETLELFCNNIKGIIRSE